ncbi:MAG: FtsX-like permease family protein, partial [Bacteroides sp.]|nr:FtsX-like permease family protein [Bacteroides sp.]
MRGGCVYIRTYDLTPEVLKTLQEKIAALYPTQEIRVRSQEASNRETYKSIRTFRDSVILSAIAILLITIVGLFGYVNDEIRHRSKEIAVRKVNGAETSDILRLLSVDVLWTALPATLTGIIFSYFIGEQWMEQFYDQKLPDVITYLGLILFILLLITGVVVLKVYR